MTLGELMNRIGFKVNDADVKNVNNTISTIKNTATKVLGTIGIGFSLVGMNKIIEKFGRVNDQIRNSTSALGDQSEIQQKILAAATATRSAYSETAKMVSNLVHENSELFGSVDEAIKFNNAATMLFKTAGKTNEDIAGLMEAINKSFAKGYVDSETLSQLLERSPEAVELLNKQLGTTSDQLEQMATDGKFTVADLKAAFVDNAEAIEAGFGNVKLRVSDALTVIRNKWGLWLTETNDMLEITSTIGTVMVKGFNMALGGITKVRNGIVWLGDKLGGMDKLLKIVAITAGTTLLVMNFSTIVGGIAKAITAIRTMDKALLGAKLKMLAIIAVIVLIALLIEDFFNFMQGNDSLIGSLFEKAGIDADAARETIMEAWSTIKEFLLTMWGVIKNAAQAIFGALSEWWAENGEAVMASFSKIWESIETLCVTLWNALSSRARTIFGALKAFWDQWGSTIISVFSTIWNTLISLIQPFLNALSALIDFLANVFTGNWQGAWQAIKDFAAAIWEGLVNILTGAWEVITTIWSAIAEFFGGIFQAAWDVIVEKVTGIKDSIVNGFQAAIDWITSLPEQALQWGADIINNIVAGIQSAVGNVVNAVSGVASTIKSFLGFSEPEDGPLSNFHTYMPDMIDLMSKGIKAGKDKVKAALGELTGDMSVSAQVEPEVSEPDVPDPKPSSNKGRGGNPRPKTTGNGDFFGGLSDFVGAASELIKAGKDKVKGFVSDFGSDLAALAGVSTVSPVTANSVTSTTSNRSVTQNVNFHNQFNGDKAIQQQAAKAMDRSAKDVTAELARGLAYTR